ncbi:MAG: mismatch-specific DNA-glycosylase [Albidovulum sp.]|nr:mismatch-specific DNA-glycosylase [Albidovulum sp.]
MCKFALPDVFGHDITLLICGSAASKRSAETGNYYAGRRNKFWPTLFQIGLTPYRLEPKEFTKLPEFGIGLTDLAKYFSGSDARLRSGDDDPSSLLDKIGMIRPPVVAFNGKRAAKSFLASNSVSYGRQENRIGTSVSFVLPSTSGAAAQYWDIRYWHELAHLVGRFQGRSTKGN